MTCEECKKRFSFFKRKKLCSDCGLNFCNSCLKHSFQGKRQCRKCKIFDCWPINKAEISSLRVRDLQHFLSTCKIPTNTCTEKHELIDLAIEQLRIKHVGHSYNYHRNFARPEGNSTATSSTSATFSTTPYDGIRVHSHTTNSDEIPLATTAEQGAGAAAAAESFSEVNLPGDTAGIRVFPFTPEDNVASPAATQSDKHNDNTSSSNQSPLLPEPMDISSSSESISHSSNSGNHFNNVPPDNEEDVIQEVHIPSPISNPNEGETVEIQENSQQLNTPIAAESRQTVVADIIKLSSLADEGAIKELSVRQCKEILILHRVDFSGVWEKHELVNKVIMVWKDFKEKQENGDSSEDQLCKICMDAIIDCVFLECGHMLACINCGKQMAECPICRQNILRVVKTFRA